MSDRIWNPIEHAPVEEIQALQLSRLIHNVYHVYDHVPYYRRRMDEAMVRPHRQGSVVTRVRSLVR